MNIGELKHRITIQQNQKVNDGQGGFSSNWVELGKLWAKAETSTPRERFYRGEDQHLQSITFIVRQNQSFLVPSSQASDNLRIVHRGDYFRVNAIAQYKYDLDFYTVTAELFGVTAT